MLNREVGVEGHYGIADTKRTGAYMQSIQLLDLSCSKCGRVATQVGTSE